jgi:cell shape-determining protein MreC
MFPSGLPVGVVATIGDMSKGFFLEIQVVPFQPEAKIEEVVVIRSEASPSLPGKGKS